jgi:hypothetical protein
MRLRMVAKPSKEYRRCRPGLQAGVVALCPHSRLPVCYENVLNRDKRIRRRLAALDAERDIGRSEEPRKNRASLRFNWNGKGPEIMGFWYHAIFKSAQGARLVARIRHTGPRFHPHDSLPMTPKYESAIFDIHRQIRGLVYTQLSGSNLRLNSTEEVSNGNAGASC